MSQSNEVNPTPGLEMSPDDLIGPVKKQPRKRTSRAATGNQTSRAKVQPLGEVDEGSMDIRRMHAASQIRNNEKKVDEVLTVWKQQMESERGLRTTTAKYVYKLLAAELVAANLAMFGMGIGLVELDKWVADVFFVGVFGNVIAIAMVVVKNLFPEPKKDLQSAVVEMVDKM